MPSSTATPIIQVEGLSKSFALYSSPTDRLREALLGGVRHVQHQALRNIQFSLAPGEALGVIGANGAGKSTLLKLILGVLEPDAGSIQARGRLTGLLELGTGFDPEATGRQNIALNAGLMGLSPEEIERITPEVIDFAELGPFIDSPLRAYSSGMAMRLGFSVAYHARPSAFVVDEALSVGDARFQQKCMDKIRAFKAQGGSLLFVSHDLHAVKTICDRVLVLHRGEVAALCAPEEAVQVYYRLIAPSQAASGFLASSQQASDYGEKSVRITSVTLASNSLAQVVLPGHVLAHDAEELVFASGAPAELHIDLQSDIAYCASVGLLIRDRFGQDIFGLNTAMADHAVALVAGQATRLTFHLDLRLAPGRYSITVAVHSGTHHTDNCQHWWDNALSFEVSGFQGRPFSGVIDLPCRVTQVTKE